jgi:acetyl esterase/lipase
LRIARSAKRLCAALVFLLLGGCSPLVAINALVPERGFIRHAGIAYGEGERGRLDVYVPRIESAVPRTVVLFFYGGAWQTGRREDHLFVAEALCSRGFVVVIPDYRLYPEVRYPAFVEDGARAVAWTAANIGRYGGDARSIALIGHSAGAHIAAMLAYNRRFLDADTRSRLKAMVGLAGPYDFKPSEAAILDLLSGEGDPGLAMPARFVRGGEPPSLLVTGDNDARVEPANTDRLARRLREAGSPVEVLVVPGLSHAGALVRLSAPFRDETLVDRIAGFIRDASVKRPGAVP